MPTYDYLNTNHMGALYNGDRGCYLRAPTWNSSGLISWRPALSFLFLECRGVAQLVARTAGVRAASGSSQGNLHLNTCFQSRSSGVAEGDREAHGSSVDNI